MTIQQPAPLATATEVHRRRALLPASACAPLLPLLATLRVRHGQVPDPDPLDGGAAARVLLLLETPGPTIGETGFVSADNPTGTARNLRRFWAESGIPREHRLIWNAIPWVIHAPGARNRAPLAAERRDGLATLPGLLALLPHLRVVILAGRVAAGAAPILPRSLPHIPMPHPSPTICCTSPAIPARIRAALAEAAALLRQE